MNNLSVVILAGGISSRFWPLSQKNVYKFFGKAPFDYHLQRIKKLNPKQIIIITNDTLELDYPQAKTMVQKGSGMAGGIMTALEFIDPADSLLVMGANDYYDDTLFELVAGKLDELKAANHAAMVAYKTPKYFPGGYLILEGDRIMGIIEKPDEDKVPSNFVNLVFHFHPTASVLSDSLKSSLTENDDLYEVAVDNLIKKDQFFEVIRYEGNWKSIKYPWHVLEVMNMFLQNIKSPQIAKSAWISEKATIKGNVIIGESVKIFEGAVINGPVYLGENTIVGNNSLVRESMIGENCVVGYASEVARSYFKDNVWLHKNYVGDSIFESNVSLGSGTITANLRLDEGDIHLKIKDKLINTNTTKLGAIIGSDVRVGVNASIMPGIRIGRNTYVGPGIVLNTDIPDNSFVKQKSVFETVANNNTEMTNSREKYRNKI